MVLKPVDENGNGDLEIQFTGLRPGEKLYEELLIDQDGVERTAHERILKSFENYYENTEINNVFLEIHNISIYTNDISNLVEILRQYVDGYDEK